MKAARALAILLPLGGCGSSPATQATPTPTVLVGLQPMARGSLPLLATAYGSVAPAINGSQTISVFQPGQVTRVAVTPGVAVRAGQMLMTFATAPSSVSIYQQAVTALATAQKQQATTAQLLGQQLATRDQLVQAGKSVADAQAAITALRSEGAGQSVRSLTAPFDGIVTVVSVAQGDRTQPGAPLITVAKSGSVVATVGLDPAQRDRVRVGQQARIARLDGGGPIAGRVVRVTSVLNARTRLIDIDLAFPAGAMLPNDAVRADVAIGQVAGWVVPHRSVVTTNGASTIYQMADGKAHAVAVRLLLAGDTQDVVDGPADPHRPLIVDGAYQLQDGAAVRSTAR